MAILLIAAGLGGCAFFPRPVQRPAAAPAPPPAPASPPPPPVAPAAAASPPPPPSSAPAPAPPPRSALPAADWSEYRLRAAWMIVAANESRSYLGKPPQPLLAIPVLEVHLRADGSVDNIRVLRRPTQALDTIKLAEEAIRRAGPFGPVAHLQRPWSFTEVFLFNHERRFKPMSLDS